MSHLDAANGANQTKKSGKHTDQHKRNTSSKSNGSGRGGSVEQHPRNKVKGESGDHTKPVKGNVTPKKTGDRGGGSVRGHDRTKGSKSSGGHLEQHPSLTNKSKGQGQTYLGKS